MFVTAEYTAATAKETAQMEAMKPDGLWLI
jgi:hypothetical protein